MRCPRVLSFCTCFAPRVLPLPAQGIVRLTAPYSTNEDAISRQASTAPGSYFPCYHDRHRIRTRPESSYDTKLLLDAEHAPLVAAGPPPQPTANGSPPPAPTATSPPPAAPSGSSPPAAAPSSGSPAEDLSGARKRPRGSAHLKARYGRMVSGLTAGTRSNPGN